MTLGKRPWESLYKLARLVEEWNEKNLEAIFLTAGFLLVLLTAQSANHTQAQPITEATPFEQLAQGQVRLQSSIPMR